MQNDSPELMHTSSTLRACVIHSEPHSTRSRRPRPFLMRTTSFPAMPMLLFASMADSLAYGGSDDLLCARAMPVPLVRKINQLGTRQAVECRGAVKCRGE